MTPKGMPFEGLRLLADSQLEEIHLAALEILRRVQPHVANLPRGLRVMLFTTEEWGLHGSRVWVDAQTPEARREIALCVQLDTIAGIFATGQKPTGMPGSVTPVSLHTWKTGSHPPLWIVGNFKWCGISLKQKARTPRSALRWISATASSVSHNGMRQSGML